ncbi:protein LTV1 homolog [Cimex lectularius]|uniref:Protein LTV1 homolog n=1 Tax=Cimex lectularius TaxID=79782 RepID=A0A8I6REM1_CIMLE|nr:protein LTV1 homolog [Cimex lectularius]
MGKKKFIDKKNAITFQLVHRSQKDPLIVDEAVPQNVLKPCVETTKAEMLKYGIYRDDGYNYLQHLKEVGTGDVELVKSEYVKKERVNKPRINLPSSVFGSTVEEKVGLLNKAAPKGLEVGYSDDLLEVYANLEDDHLIDEESEIEDNFMEIAGEVIPEGEEKDGVDYDEFGEDDEFSDEELRDNLLDLEETKTRFTEYSMTSSVMRRNEQLTMLDDRFEEMFSQYDDNEIGALDTEDIEGEMDPQTTLMDQLDNEEGVKNDSEVIKFDTSKYNYVCDESSGNESDCSLIELKEKEKWDCESILSTYSNIYNHPKLIGAPPSNKIKINPKTGIPITTTRLTASALADHNGKAKSTATGPGSLVSIVSTLSIRPKDETRHEKTSRKKAFKVYKKERRIERKLNTEAFKEEKKRMEKIMANNKTKHMIPI